MSVWLNRYILVFSVSLAIAYFVTPIVRILSAKFGIIDFPIESGKIHAKPIPRWGGVSVYFAYSIAIIITFYYTNPLKVIVTGGLLVLILGMIDDIKRVPATLKLFILTGLTIWLSTQGIIIKLSHIYFIDLMITVIWIVGVTSAFNSIDNMDGLAAGIAFIASALFFIVAVESRQWWFGLLSVALAGSCLGFLRYNFKSATIFLGDGGSLFLGFTLAAIAVMGEWSNDVIIAYSIPVLILAIPIFDITFVVIWRYKNGITKNIKESIIYCGKDHLSHRLEKLGLNRNQAVLILYFLSISLGIGAVVLRVSSDIDALLLIFQTILILFIVLILLTINKRR